MPQLTLVQATTTASSSRPTTPPRAGALPVAATMPVDDVLADRAGSRWYATGSRRTAKAPHAA